MNPGFCSCPNDGTNHPVHPDTACALVLASPLKYQVLPTSALKGDTTQAGDKPGLHIKNPPPKEEPSAPGCGRNPKNL